jgi:HEPN domain-containing protein
MNRTDLQHLAQERAREAETLLNAGHWSGSYYLIGYAVECALKACIAKLTKEYDFPDKDRALKCFTHKIEVLVEVAVLEDRRKADVVANPVRRDNWVIIKDWNEQARYKRWTEAKARELFTAITDTTNGVLPWIMGHW